MRHYTTMQRVKRMSGLDCALQQRANYVTQSNHDAVVVDVPATSHGV